MKTPSTEEPLRAPGSESNFTGLPSRKQDIPVTSPVSPSRQMQEHIDLVKSDFRFVFKDIMDLDHFERNMFFSDPISKFTFFRGKPALPFLRANLPSCAFSKTSALAPLIRAPMLPAPEVYELKACVGYQVNCQFLRYFLAPIFEVHEVRQAGEHEILVKWSWTMNFWWNRFNPFRFVWDPRLAFSGWTILGYNPDTGASLSMSFSFSLMVCRYFLARPM